MQSEISHPRNFAQLERWFACSRPLSEKETILFVHSAALATNPAYLPMPYSRRSDVALRIDARSPGMTSAPIFAAAKVRRPASFNDAPVQKISF